MKSDQLLKALGQVDEAYIEQAAPGNKRKNRWTRWCALAASLCIVMVGAIALLPELAPKSADTAEMESVADNETDRVAQIPAKTSEMEEPMESVAEESKAITDGEDTCGYPLRGFDNMMAAHEEEMLYTITESVAMFTRVTVGTRIANYEQVYGYGTEELADYIGTPYLTAEDEYQWYYPAGKTNLKYLIREDETGELTLWVFRSFVVERMAEIQTEHTNFSAYTYGEVCREIYGLNDASQIVQITAFPSTANNTDLGIQIQQEIGTTVYEDRDSIETFFAIAEAVVCFGESDWADYNAAENQYTYSFSTDAEDKLLSGEEIYGTRYLTITLEDGTTIDSWKYNALRGCFYEFGGIGTQVLPAEEVQQLNAIFGIF